MHKTLVSVLLLLVATAVYGFDRPPTEWTGIPDIYSLPSSTPDRRGTEVQPFVVDQSQDALRREEAAQAEHASNERWMTIATVVLAVFTVALWLANVWLVLESRRVSARQARDTKDAIKEATRSADAMNEVATATRNNATLMQGMLHKQMRAYLSVDIGTATYQTDALRFEALPLIANYGLTPARNVCFKVMVDILDGSQPTVEPSFADVGDLIINDVGIAPRQSFTIRGLLPTRVPGEDVDQIMLGASHRLFAWGKVTYDDVYGGSWETNFCISYWFPKVGDSIKVFGNFYHRHNNAT
jgi:hypothetical protein